MLQISIIVPVYNVEKYLSKCLDSILAQTFVDFEVICINDGSLDNSDKILADYGKRDKRIKIITQKNQGVSIARNKGLLHAKGEYVAFIDSDDFWHPQALEIMYTKTLNNNLDILCFNFNNVTAEQNIVFPKLPLKQKVHIIQNSFFNFAAKAKDIKFGPLWNKFYKKTVLKDLRFNSNCLIAEDALFNFHAFANAKKMGCIKDKLYFYLYNPNSAIHSKYSLKKILSFLVMIEEIHQNFYSKPQYSNLSYKRISYNLKNALKHLTNCSEKEQVHQKIKELYAKKIISYQGLSLKRRFQLYKILKG